MEKLILLDSVALKNESAQHGQETVEFSNKSNVHELGSAKTAYASRIIKKVHEDRKLSDPSTLNLPARITRMKMVSVLCLLLDVMFVTSRCLGDRWHGPLGVIQCHQRCSFFCECKSILYTQENLMCHLYNEDKDPTIPMLKPASAECSSMKKCVRIYTREAVPVCVSTDKTRGSSEDKENITRFTRLDEDEDMEKRTRLLITTAPEIETSPEIYRQLNLQTHSVELYRYLSVPNTGVFYSALLKGIVVSALTGDILLYPVNSTLKRVFKHNMACRGLAEDTRKNIIFLSISRKLRSGVYKTNGKLTDFKLIFHHIGGGRNSDVTLDSRRQIIYCTTLFRVFSFTYSGANCKVLVQDENEQLRALSFNRGCLYYSKDKELFKMQGQMSKRVLSMKYTLKDMVYYKNTMYFSTKGLDSDTNIGILTSTNTLNMVKISHNAGAIPWVSICAIP